MRFYPEGRLIDTPENRAALRSPAALAEAMGAGRILEARALLCDSSHDLVVDLGKLLASQGITATWAPCGA